MSSIWQPTSSSFTTINHRLVASSSASSSSKSSSSGSSSKSFSSNSDHRKYAFLNHSTSSKEMLNLSEFKFKPMPATVNGTVASRNSNSFNKNAKQSSQSYMNSMLHNKSKDGKILKRKQDKKLSTAVLQCFNLDEKEKYRQLLSQSLTSAQKDQLFTQSKGGITNGSSYYSLIKSSPTKTRDDNLIEEKRAKNVASTLAGALDASSPNPFSKISVNYSRRINFFPDTTLKLPDIAAVVANKKTESTRIEAGQVPDLRNKVPIKRHNITSIDLSLDENENNVVVLDNLKEEIKSSSVQNLSRLNREATDKEKNWSDRLEKNNNILVEILKKFQNSQKEVEEERYKLKKRQRLEREKAEKELALRFQQQLKLDFNKIAAIRSQEDEVEIEDEFPELDENQERLVDQAFIPHPGDEVLSSAFDINITRRDLQTLKGLNWLNDEIINFYMSLICERSKTTTNGSGGGGGDYLKAYAFTTFFYPKLCKDGYTSVRRWTRKVDLFSYDLLLVPLHLGMHWTLAAVDFKCKEIRYYDSMNGNNHECLKILRNYLTEEHSDKKSGSQFDLSGWSCLHVKDIPQQMNGSDCGMFACKFAEYLSRGRLNFSFNQTHMPYFRRRMVFEILAKKLM